MNNIKATKLLKQLCDDCARVRGCIVMDDAFAIYNQIKHRKNASVIHSMLKVFIRGKRPEMVQNIWNDILCTAHVSYPLVLQCLVQVHPNDLDLLKCIHALQSIHSISHYQQKDYLRSVSKLITKCDQRESLYVIYDLITKINHSDSYIWSAFITSFAKCNATHKAQHVLHSVPRNQIDTPCFNAMMTGFIHNQLDAKALELYDEQLQSGNSNDVSHKLAMRACARLFNEWMTNGQCNDIIKLYFKYDALMAKDDKLSLLALKACVDSSDFNTGQRIACDIMKHNVNKRSVQLVNALINFYGHSADTVHVAKRLYDAVDKKKKDIVTLNSMMTVFNKYKYYKHTLAIYDQYYADAHHHHMHSPNTRHGLDDVAHVLALQACSHTNDYDKGKRIICKHIDHHLFGIAHVSNAMLDFWGHFNAMNEAETVFNEMQSKDTVSINSMIKSYVKNGCYDAALRVYNAYQHLVDDVSHLLVLKACVAMNEYETGALYIDKIHKTEHKHLSLQLHTTLIDFYGHFAKIEMAQHIFDSITSATHIQHNAISINLMMKTYLKNDRHSDVLTLYEMYSELRDDVSCLNALKACIALHDFDEGKAIHAFVVQNINIKWSKELENTCIEFYGHFGDIEGAKRLFDKINTSDVDLVNINTMMEVCVTNDMNLDCIDLFDSIGVVYGLQSDMISFVLVLKAATQSTSYHYGKQIYDDLKRNYPQYLSHKSVVINLINLYGKCGVMDMAQDIFDTYSNCNATNHEITNAMIKAFGRNGEMLEIQKMYQTLRDDNHDIDRKTYIVLINAYSHGGYIKEAEDMWCNEIKNEKIKFDCYVVTSLMDCFARNGYLGKAKQLIEQYETNNAALHAPMWVSLMNGCKLFENKDMAQCVYTAFSNKPGVDHKHLASASVLLSNTMAIKDPLYA